MSELTLKQATSAPLQHDRETRYTAQAHALIHNATLYYYRVSDFYRDWISVYAHDGTNLGTYRTLDAFLGETGSGENRQQAEEPADAMTRALLAQIRPLVGHRVTSVDVANIAAGLPPAPLLRFDNGVALLILADAEGNGGGFPEITKA